MKLRTMALIALCGALVPVWASEVITHETRINRQRITTVLNAPGAVLPPQINEFCQNRQRITTLNDLPGMVRNALPVDPQIDRSRLDCVPRPGPYMRQNPVVPQVDLQRGRITVPPRPVEKAPARSTDQTPADESPTFREEVLFLQEAKQEKAKEEPLPSGKVVEEKLILTDWVCGRRMTDDKGRVWHLIQGVPQIDKPREYPGWMMQASDSPIYFFSRTGRMWRLISIPLP